MGTNLSKSEVEVVLSHIRRCANIDEVLDIRKASHNLTVNEACAFKCEHIAERTGWLSGDMRTFALKKRLKVAPIPIATWFELSTGKTHGGLFEPNRTIRLFVNRKYDCGRGCELIFYYTDGKLD